MGPKLRKASMIVVAAALFASPALAAQQDFTVHNSTGKVMTSLFVSPTGDDQWGPDILGRGTLDSGEDASIEFDRAEDKCEWDVKADFEDGSSGEDRDINLCSVTDVTFNPG